MVGVGEIDGHSGVVLKFLVVVHLSAVVERETAFEMFREWCEELFGFRAEVLFGCFRDMPNKRVAALPLYVRHKIAAMLLTYDCITFPMAVKQSVVYGLGPLINPALLL